MEKYLANKLLMLLIIFNMMCKFEILPISCYPTVSYRTRYVNWSASPKGSSPTMIKFWFSALILSTLVLFMLILSPTFAVCSVRPSRFYFCIFVGCVLARPSRKQNQDHLAVIKASIGLTVPY